MEKKRDIEFIQFLAASGHSLGEDERLPTLRDLSDELDVSISRLREQLEVARALGLVQVRPRAGIRRLPYQFLPAVRLSLAYAIETDWKYFEHFSDLRTHIEAAYWHQAVRMLTPRDHVALQDLIHQAWGLLRGQPIQIPHREHRELHLSIYRRLENPFVLGILEAYWEAYEAVGLNLFTDYAYLERVWSYHQEMVAAIVAGDYEAGYQALVDHTDLLHHRPVASATAGEQSVPVGTG